MASEHLHVATSRPDILCIQDLRETVLYLEQNMGSVPTVTLCALTKLIKVTALHMALFNTLIFTQEQKSQLLQTFMHTC